MASEEETAAVAQSVEPEDLRTVAERFEEMARDIEKRRRLAKEETEPCAICGDPTRIKVQKRLDDVAVGTPTPYCDRHTPTEGRHAV